MYIRRDVHTSRTSPLFLCSVGGWGGNVYSPKKIWKRIPVAIGEGWCQRDDLWMWQIPGLLVDGWKMLEGWENEGLCHRYIGDPQVGFRSEKPCLRTCQCKYIFSLYTYIGYGRHPSSNCDHQNSSILSRGSLQIFTCHCYWEGATPSIYIHIHIHQKASMSQVELQCFEPEDSSLIHGATSGPVKWYMSLGMKFYFMMFELMVNRNLWWIRNRQIMTDFWKMIPTDLA